MKSSDSNKKSEKKIDQFVSKFFIFLQKKGLKLTKQRKELAEWIFSRQNHFTADDIAFAFAQHRWVSKATIYRTLSLMVEAELVEEHNFGEGYKTYEVFLSKEHHDHLICMECGKVVEFKDNEIEAHQEKIAQENRFILKHHSLKLYGLCFECRKKNI